MGIFHSKAMRRIWEMREEEVEYSTGDASISGEAFTLGLGPSGAIFDCNELDVAELVSVSPVPF